MKRILVLNLVGISPDLLQCGHMPKLAAYAQQHEQRSIQPALPAVTCTAQANMLLGAPPSVHGAVANGWYFRDLAEVWLWRQSSHLIRSPQQPSIFDRWRQQYPQSKTAQIFWWWNLPGFADLCVTPRPTYFADGSKGPDIHSYPPSLRDDLRRTLGDFPLFQFWGPGAGIASTRWIAEATIRILRQHQPGLALSYLPHLDYDFQRFGPNSPQAARAAAELDQEFARLLACAEELGYHLVALSEYGIESVQHAVFPNRTFRQEGLLAIHPAVNGSLLDPGNSRAFAVCDHQLAHVYISKRDDIPEVRKLCESMDGVEQILEPAKDANHPLHHPRSGELVLLAKAGFWFAYPYWAENETEPDFARTVDIHRKPGYDPLELFLDPQKPLLKARIAWRLLKKKMGMRMCMDVVPLDTSLVRGSHGRPPSSPALGPVWIGPAHLCPPGATLDSTEVFAQFLPID